MNEKINKDFNSHSVNDNHDIKGRYSKKNLLKLSIILSSILFISAGILTTFYNSPNPIPAYVDTTKWDGANDVFVSGDYAYVADIKKGLAIINVSDPLNPGITSHIYTTGTAEGIFISGDYAYVADGLYGLAIINVSDPLNPDIISYIDTTGMAEDVFVSGDYAYVADSESGLAIINVSDPLNPGNFSYIDTTNISYGVFVSGEFAYVADSESGLAIINVSDPLNPSVPLYINTTGMAKDVFVSGEFAYVADSESGLAIINVSDPLNPSVPLYINTTGTAEGIFISGDYAYVADGLYGLAIINVSDPLNPGIPSYIDTTGMAEDIFISGDYMYVADRESELAIIDLSNIFADIESYNLNQTNALVGRVISIIIGVIFSVITLIMLGGHNFGWWIFGLFLQILLSGIIPTWIFPDATYFDPFMAIIDILVSPFGEDLGSIDYRMPTILNALADGAALTFNISIVSVVFGFLLAIILAVILVNKSNLFGLKFLAQIYVDFFRSTPLLVQILLVYFGLPRWLIDLIRDLNINYLSTEIFAGLLALTLNTAAYQAEIIRSGILAIPTGQAEAARSLGLSSTQTMRYVILPQAIRIIVPPLTNELINVLLNSSLISAIGVTELTKRSQSLQARYFLWQVFLMAAVFYFVIAYSMSKVAKEIENKLKIPGLGVAND